MNEQVIIEKLDKIIELLSKPKDPLFNTDPKGEVEVDVKDMRVKDKEQPKE